LKHDRGASLLSFIESFFKNTIYLWGGGFFLQGLMNRTKFNVLLAPIISFVYSMLRFFIGWLDEKWGFWKVQNRIASKELNPFFEEMADDIKEIKEKLK
jgi:hypothetical protein